MPERLILGRIFATFSAYSSITRADIFKALQRHATGDWGEVTSKTKRLNSIAVTEGQRIYSEFVDPNATRFQIVTEGDRSRTTIYLC